VICGKDYKTDSGERILQVLPETLLAARQQPADSIVPISQVVTPCD
jgi:hypothetical protein